MEGTPNFGNRTLCDGDNLTSKRTELENHPAAVLRTAQPHQVESPNAQRAAGGEQEARPNGRIGASPL